MLLAVDPIAVGNAFAIVIGAIALAITGYARENARLAREKVLDDREDAKIERDRIAAELVATVAKKADSAEKAVIEVKDTLVQTTEAQAAHNETQTTQLAHIAEISTENAKISVETHSLVNGMTTAHLSLIADMAEEAARDNPKNHAYVERAKATRVAYDAHVARIKAASINP